MSFEREKTKCHVSCYCCFYYFLLTEHNHLGKIQNLYCTQKVRRHPSDYKKAIRAIYIWIENQGRGRQL